MSYPCGDPGHTPQRNLQGSAMLPWSEKCSGGPAMSFENCPRCGTRKHQIAACQRCGFSRRADVGAWQKPMARKLSAPIRARSTRSDLAPAEKASPWRVKVVHYPPKDTGRKAKPVAGYTPFAAGKPRSPEGKHEICPACGGEGGMSGGCTRCGGSGWITRPAPADPRMDRQAMSRVTPAR